MPLCFNISTNAKFKEDLAFEDLIDHIDRSIQFLKENEKRIERSYISSANTHKYESYSNWKDWEKLKELGVEIEEGSLKIKTRYETRDGLCMYFLYCLAELLDGPCYFHQRYEWYQYLDKNRRYQEYYKRYEVSFVNGRPIVRFFIIEDEF